MDIFDYTLIEMQRLGSSPSKAREYLCYLEFTPCVFSPTSKERAFLSEKLGSKPEQVAKWDHMLHSLPAVKNILRSCVDRTRQTKKNTDLLNQFINTERELLNCYHVNKTMRSQTKNFSCFHQKDDYYPLHFPVSLAFTKKYDRELRSVVNQVIHNGHGDFSADFMALASVNLESLVVCKDDIRNMISALKNNMPLEYILDDYCDFYVSHPLSGYTLETLMTEQITSAFETISFAYDLRCAVRRESREIESGWQIDKPAIYSIHYYVQEENMEKLYMQRLMDCNNTQIFSH